MPRVGFVPDPGAAGESFAEMADPFSVDPEGELTVSFSDVVQVDHHFDAVPFFLLNLQFFSVDKPVSPGFSVRRTASHFMPVHVVVPGPAFAERLDADRKLLVPSGKVAGVHFRPGMRLIIAADAGAHVMNRDTNRSESYVHPTEDPVVTESSLIIFNRR